MLSLSGIFPPIVTPFEKDEISYAHLAENIKKWNRYDLAGYVLLGSNGENVMLNQAECLQVIETAVKYVPEGKRIIIGTSGESTRVIIDFLKQAHHIGGDAGLVLSPHYYRDQMKTTVMVDFFTEIADKSPMPIILYNVPKFTGLEISADAVARLAGHANIVGIKDSSGNLTYLQTLLSMNLKRFQVLTGTANTLLASLIMGATGGILSLANILPQLCLNIYQAAMQGKLDKARKLQLSVIRLNQLTTAVYGIGGLKYALDQIGYFGGIPRRPLPGPDPRGKEEILQELKKLKPVKEI